MFILVPSLLTDKALCADPLGSIAAGRGPRLTAYKKPIRSLSELLRRIPPASWRRSGSGPSEDEDWRRTIDRVIMDLEKLNRSTEHDFLAVGEKLMGFRTSARQIASEMSGLTDLISGEQGNASHALGRLLEHCRDVDARIEESGRALGQVRELSNRIRVSFGGLRNMASVFQALCTLTSIETSRLGSTGADFGDLAAEVRPLSESIQASGENVQETVGQLDRDIQSTIRSCAAIRARQVKELPELVAGIENGLKAFQERRERAVETSLRQAAQYGALCESVDGVVRSIQFHDITRQQIEHVLEALRQLLTRSANGRGSPGVLSSESRTILTLQSSQLAAAAATFATSVANIERDLESITVRAQDAAVSSKALIGISPDVQESFFLQMESHFAALLKMLASSTAAQEEMGSAAARLDESIGLMRGSIDEIRGIEIRIQRIATNATIRAIHIGPAGNALNVISDVMQRLALDSNANTEDVAAALQSIGDAATHVSRGSAGAGLGSDRGSSEMVGEMRREVVEMHKASDSSLSRVKQIAALGAGLAGDIGEVRKGLTAGVLLTDVVNRVCGQLDRIVAQAGHVSMECVNVTPALQLESVARHYTMQTERDVHETVVRGSVSALPSTSRSNAAVEDEDLGDNVQLF